MRSSLRDPCCERDQCVYVPDLVTAEWLKTKFPDARLERLEIDIGNMNVRARRGRNRIHGSDAERKKAQRAGQKERLSLLMNTVFNGKIPNTLGLPSTRNNSECHDIPLYKGINVSTMKGSLFSDLYSKAPYQILETDTIGDFELFLKDCHKKHFEKKEDNELISPSFFDRSLSEDTSRGRENVVFAHGIWLDINHGNFTPKMMAETFPTLRMTISNSYRNSKAELRYRVYIPTTEHTIAHDYKVIVNNIIHKIDGECSRMEGIYVGIDNSKLNAESLFYLPCQPKDPSGIYFKTFNGQGRKPLDPNEWNTRKGRKEHR